MKWMFIFFSLSASGLASFYAQPLVRENPEAISVVITTVTVFAGFLVAIIAILGDPAMVPNGSWRVAENRHKRLETMIIRYTWLFYLYLLTISLLFAGVIIRKASDDAVSASVKSFIEYAYLFVGTFAFAMTLFLPGALGRVQMARSEAEIERRRLEHGISPSSGAPPD